MARTKSETAKVAEAEVVETPAEDIKKENDDLKAQLVVETPAGAHGADDV